MVSLVRILLVVPLAFVSATASPDLTDRASASTIPNIIASAKAQLAPLTLKIERKLLVTGCTRRARVYLFVI